MSLGSCPEGRRGKTGPQGQPGVPGPSNSARETWVSFGGYPALSENNPPASVPYYLIVNGNMDNKGQQTYEPNTLRGPPNFKAAFFSNVVKVSASIPKAVFSVVDPELTITILVFEPDLTTIVQTLVIPVFQQQCFITPEPLPLIVQPGQVIRVQVSVATFIISIVLYLRLFTL